MTPIITTPITGEEVGLMFEKSFNMFELMEQYKTKLAAADVDSLPRHLKRIWKFWSVLEIPEAFKYHDIHVGVLNTGDMIIGESTLADVTMYQRKYGVDNARKSMMDKLYEWRAFLMKNAIAGVKVVDNLRESEVNYLRSHLLGHKFPSELYTLDLHWFIGLPNYVPPVVLVGCCLPNDFTAMDYRQALTTEVEINTLSDLHENARTALFMRIDTYRAHLARFNRHFK